MSFLGKGNWKMTLWRDAPESTEHPEHLMSSEKTTNSSNSLDLKLAPSGGMVAILSPID